MTTIVTRTGVGGKGSPLTHVEVDTNFTRLNTFKVEQTSDTGFAQLPAGTTAQRGTGAAGALRHSTTDTRLEWFSGSNWFHIFTQNMTIGVANGGTGSTTAAGARTNLGATTLGANPFTLANVAAISFPRINADNTVSSLSAADFRTAIGAVSTSGASISNDTTADASYYPIWTTSTSGTPTTVYVSNTKLYFNPSTGTLNATNFNSLSDATLKQNIVEIEDASAIIKQIDGVEFEWQENGKKSAGVIAQKLEEILPHLVETSTVGIKSVNYSGLVAYLIQALKQQDSRITELERIINK